MGVAQRAPVVKATAVLATAADFRDAMIRQLSDANLPRGLVSRRVSILLRTYGFTRRMLASLVRIGIATAQRQIRQGWRQDDRGRSHQGHGRRPGRAG